MHHIKNTLPEIKSKIQTALAKYQQELLQLGDPLNDNHASMVLNIVTEFCNEFRTIIDGNANDLSSFELSGGARISFVFHELYSNGVKTIDPFDQVKDSDIRMFLYNSAVWIDWDTRFIMGSHTCFRNDRVLHLPCLWALQHLKSLSSNK